MTVDPAFLRQLLSLPTAPYHEHHVFRAIAEHVSGWPDTRLQMDRFGNLLVQTGVRKSRAIRRMFVAHLDHPGFVVSSTKDRSVHFLGGVAESFFKGKTVRFYRMESPEVIGEGVIRSVQRDSEKLRVEFNGAIPDAHFGQWKLPPPRINQRLIQATAIDDLAGVAAILSALETCARNGVTAAALLTRAEEVGFHGTLAWLKDNQNGPRPIVISIEMSNHRSYAEPGAGPVLRVGDRARIFSPEVTRWMQQEMEALSGAGDFQFQRKLMSGGTCEGTPFALAGYPTGALCLPLENYHNQGADHAIEPEAVRRSDWEQLVRILVRLAECPFPGPKAGALERRLRDYTKAGTQALRRQPLS